MHSLDTEIEVPFPTHQNNKLCIAWNVLNISWIWNVNILRESESLHIDDDYLLKDDLDKGELTNEGTELSSQIKHHKQQSSNQTR